MDAATGIRGCLRHCVFAMSKGLRLEAAASITARDMITRHLTLFGPAIRRDRIAGQSTVAAYVDGLAGAAALVIAGGQGSQLEVIEGTIKSLKDAIQRDLKHLKATP